MTEALGGTVVHVWLSGQSDNIGDSALRRAYADALRRRGSLSAWVGNPRSPYAKGVALSEPEARSTFASWCFGILRTSWSGKAVFAFNAGEFIPTKRYLAGIVLLLPILAVHRARGGKFVWLGAGIRRGRERFLWPFRLLARWSDPLAFRDRSSIELIGSGEPMPDWAFALAKGGRRQFVGTGAPNEQGRRDRIAVILRGDRATPSQAWVDEVRALARRLGAVLVVIVQVGRDSDAAHVMAERLGAELIDWSRGLDHRRQEELVRHEYSRSIAVLSDRLHALIIASTEGAVPLGWCETANDKIARHFDLVGGSWVASGDRGSIELIRGLDHATVAQLHGENRQMVERACAAIDSVAARLP